MKNTIFFIFLFYSLFTSSAFSTTKDYRSQATLIVQGKIGSPIECSDEITRDYCCCTGEISYTVPLLVKTVVKGQIKSKSLQINFCSTGPTSPPVTGEEGVYYLKQSPKKTLQLIFSDQVIYAAGSLPKCK